MITPKTLAKMARLYEQYEVVSAAVMDPSTLRDSQKLKTLRQKQSRLEPLANLYEQYQKNAANIVDLKATKVAEPELADLVNDDLKRLATHQKTLGDQMKMALLNTQEQGSNRLIMELSGAAGGDEANIFAGDLFDMYCRWAEKKHWKITILEARPSDAGGFANISFFVEGKDAWRHLKYEAGTHRVQRVPKTETKGRIHTSTATVAVLPEIKSQKIDINPKDLKIDTYRSSGAGGQHVNKTDSAIRITHLPTKTVVTSQAGRSQHDNKALALEHLQIKLLQQKQLAAAAERQALRRSAVGSGDRSEKIRTYNYPQNRITDHRVQQSWSQLQMVMEGNLDTIVEALAIEEQRKLLEDE